MAFDLTPTIDLITAVNDALTTQRGEITAIQGTLATVKQNLESSGNQPAGGLNEGEVAVDGNQLNLLNGVASQMMNNLSPLVESIGLLKIDVNSLLPPAS